MKKIAFILILIISAINSFTQAIFGQANDANNIEVNIHPDFFSIGHFL